MTPPSLSSFWSATLSSHVAAMDAATLSSEHEQICSAFDEAMTDGYALPAWQWERLSALQAERGRRSSHVSAPALSGPFLVHYEVSVADGPGSLPLRLSLPLLCF